MGELIGLIIAGLVYGVFWALSNFAKQAEEKNKQEAAERQRKMMAARQQQQDTAGHVAPKMKSRQTGQQRGGNGETPDPLVTAESVSRPPLKRESMFDTPVDGARDHFGNESPGLAGDLHSTVKSLSEQPNPVALGIMAMMTTPQSMQQAVLLSEIFNRPKY
ncbi:MAG: hypothetical protein FWH27_10785 [Planctomycetaceae bacterium]|nr:hypothetical protein [Planctomycetaceae bacterium]